MKANKSVFEENNSYVAIHYIGHICVQILFRDLRLHTAYMSNHTASSLYISFIPSGLYKYRLPVSHVLLHEIHLLYSHVCYIPNVTYSAVILFLILLFFICYIFCRPTNPVQSINQSEIFKVIEAILFDTNFRVYRPACSRDGPDE